MNLGQTQNLRHSLDLTFGENKLELLYFDAGFL